MSDKWDLRFIELAHHISSWSKDPSTKVGCVVVGADREIRSTGFNGFPRGIDDSLERLQNREEKYRGDDPDPSHHDSTTPSRLGRLHGDGDDG